MSWTIARRLSSSGSRTYLLCNLNRLARAANLLQLAAEAVDGALCNRLRPWRRQDTALSAGPWWWAWLRQRALSVSQTHHSVLQNVNAKGVAKQVALLAPQVAVARHKACVERRQQ